LFNSKGVEHSECVVDDDFVFTSPLSLPVPPSPRVVVAVPPESFLARADIFFFFEAFDGGRGEEREREAKFFENSGLSDACLAVAM